MDSFFLTEETNGHMKLSFKVSSESMSEDVKLRGRGQTVVLLSCDVYLKNIFTKEKPPLFIQKPALIQTEKKSWWESR